MSRQRVSSWGAVCILAGVLSFGCEAQMSGGGGLPSGAIVLWDGAECPEGFAEVPAYDGKFLVAADSAGDEGGSDTHTHAPGDLPGHTHTVPRSGWGASLESKDNVAGRVATAPNESNVATRSPSTSSANAEGDPRTGESDSRPAFRTVKLCKKG